MSDATETAPPMTGAPYAESEPPTAAARAGMLERYFQLSAHGTSVRTEIIAGLTIFATMAYVLAVNPMILANTGMPLAPLITVTALAAAISCIAMGLISNYPLALAPHMGANAFFTYQVCLGMKIPWQAALGFVFYNAILFFILAATGIREMLIRAFPPFLRAGITAGIGLFIAFIGLHTGGVIVTDKETFVALGRVASSECVLVLAGLVLMSVLLLRGFRMSIILTIVVLTIAGFFLPAADGLGHITPLPSGFVSLPTSITPLFLHLDLTYPLHHFQKAFPVILALLFTDFFCCFAAQLAICQRAGLLDANSNLPGMRRALCIDASAAGVGALLGTSTTGVYIESAAGVEQGGRTGLTVVVTGLCFVVALLLNPLIQIIPAAATAPALILIGIFMMQELTKQNFTDLAQATPAILTTVLMPLATISDGIAIGFLAHVAIQIGIGNARRLPVFSLVLAALFLLHYVFA
jgi:AGZA family xanthine/uracil permease-like MFS transporter